MDDNWVCEVRKGFLSQCLHSCGKGQTCIKYLPKCPLERYGTFISWLQTPGVWTPHTLGLGLDTGGGDSHTVRGGPDADRRRRDGELGATCCKNKKNLSSQTGPLQLRLKADVGRGMESRAWQVSVTWGQGYFRESGQRSSPAGGKI